MELTKLWTASETGPDRGQARTAPARSDRLRPPGRVRLAAALFAAALTGLAQADPDAETPAAPETEEAAEHSPAPSLTDASALAAYLAAVGVHVERDPALAATYMVFWSELRDAAHAGRALSEVAPDAFVAMSQTGARVAAAVRQHYRGSPPIYATSEALSVALQTLAQERGHEGNRAERLLANLDRGIAPLVLVNGRYEHTGNLTRPADLGFGAEVWLLCRQSPACMDAHDNLFAQAMAGSGIADSAEIRLARDGLLANAAQVPTLLAGAADLSARIAAADTAQSIRDVAGFAAREYWRSIATGVPALPGAADPGLADPAASMIDVPGLEALFILGRAGAYLAGQETLANVFAVTRAPVLDFASTATQGALLGAFGPYATGVGLLFAGVQAMALFDTGPGELRGSAPAELRQLVISLNDATYQGLRSARAEQLLATTAVDARVAALGLALDVVKTDVARLETAARRRIGSDYQAATARRWTSFDEDNDRCFGLRHRDPRTGVLRAAEFRRCEDRFLQGATRRSQYATRASEYVLDARFITPGDARFPFHDHYPLLTSFGGLDARAALALPDPLDWQQHTAALLRLYQENPAGTGEAQKRREALVAVQAAGARAHQALLGLAVREAPGGMIQFREDLHHKALDDYFQALRSLAARVGAMDDPDAHPFGKRLTEGLNQPLPLGLKRSAVEAALSGAANGGRRLAACSNAPISSFQPDADRLLAESRRFFGTPVRPEELTAAWNRDVVNALGLQPGSYAELVPVPFIWASLEGLGTLEVCLTQFRPETVAFTRDRGPVRDTLLGTTLIGAELEVRFRPEPGVAQAADLPGDGRMVVARYRAERACTFGYRNDDEDCSRAECLPKLVPLLWGSDTRIPPSGARCEGETLAAQLPRHNLLGNDQSLAAVVDRLDSVYRAGLTERLARLEADILRSDEYEHASALYLKYYALAGITLGTWPDRPEDLAGLFGPSQPLAPRGIVDALVHERIDSATLFKRLEGRAENIRRAVAERGRALDATGRTPPFPHLRTLEEALARVELAVAAYSGG